MMDPSNEREPDPQIELTETDIKAAATFTASIFRIISGVVGFFLFVFIIYGCIDYSNHGNSKESAQNAAVSEPEKPELTPEEQKAVLKIGNQPGDFGVEETVMTLIRNNSKTDVKYDGDEYLGIGYLKDGPAWVYKISFQQQNIYGAYIKHAGKFYMRGYSIVYFEIIN